MQNLDPGEKQQKALPVSVYRELHRRANESGLTIDKTIAWLQTMAFFWCLHSCEYSDVQGEHNFYVLEIFVSLIRITKIFQANTQENAFTVSITFEFQKKEVRNDTISHQRSGNKIGYGEMCPVRATIQLVLRIDDYGFPSDK
jgi:hypothetical protein